MIPGLFLKAEWMRDVLVDMLRRRYAEVLEYEGVRYHICDGPILRGMPADFFKIAKQFVRVTRRFAVILVLVTGFYWKRK